MSEINHNLPFYIAQSCESLLERELYLQQLTRAELALKHVRGGMRSQIHAGACTCVLRVSALTQQLAPTSAARRSTGTFRTRAGFGSCPLELPMGFAHSPFTWGLFTFLVTLQQIASQGNLPFFHSNLWENCTCPFPTSVRSRKNT